MLNSFEIFIRKLNTGLAKLCAAIIWIMMLIMALIVVFRYLFNFGSVAAQEIISYLHAFVFLMGAGYTLQVEAHVRVDIFYRRLSEHGKAYVNLLGTILFLIPLSISILYFSWDYVYTAWGKKEASGEAGGLAFLYVLKSLLAIFPVLLSLNSISYTITALKVIHNKSNADTKRAVT